MLTETIPLIGVQQESRRYVEHVGVAGPGPRPVMLRADWEATRAGPSPVDAAAVCHPYVADPLRRQPGLRLLDGVVYFAGEKHDYALRLGYTPLAAVSEDPPEPVAAPADPPATPPAAEPTEPPAVEADPAGG